MLRFKRDFNVKVFLAPNAIESMAAVHAKIYKDKNQYQFRISDCNNCVKLWGNIESEQDKLTAIEKLENLARVADQLRKEIIKQLK